MNTDAKEAIRERGQLWAALDVMTISTGHRDTVYSLWALYDVDTAIGYLNYLKVHPDAPVVGVEAAVAMIGTMSNKEHQP